MTFFEFRDVKNENNAVAVTKNGNQSIANRPSIKIMDFRPKNQFLL